MRYALLPALLVCGCLGEAFTPAPPSPTPSDGGAQSGGRASAGGATASGGSAASGGARLDASTDGDVRRPDDASADVAPEATTPFERCPLSVPPPSSACSGTFDCAYGEDPRVTCREVWQCRGGRWLVSSKACPPLRYCSGFASAPIDGAPCSTRGEFCTYAVGDDCACMQGATLAWRCAPKPPAPCARRPENEGQPCGDAGGTCTYGFCGSPDRVQTACEGGVLSWSVPSCN